MLTSTKETQYHELISYSCNDNCTTIAIDLTNLVVWRARWGFCYWHNRIELLAPRTIGCPHLTSTRIVDDIVIALVCRITDYVKRTKPITLGPKEHILPFTYRCPHIMHNVLRILVWCMPTRRISHNAAIWKSNHSLMVSHTAFRCTGNILDVLVQRATSCFQGGRNPPAPKHKKTQEQSTTSMMLFHTPPC